MAAIARAKRYGSGFTLLELLAVILIAGILAAMSVPTFNAILKGTALNTAAKALTDTFSLGRQFAITNRYLYHVELDDVLTAAERADKIDDFLQKHRYRIYFVDRDARDPDNPTEADKITVRKWRLLPDFVKYDLDKRPPKEIVFKPTGGANGYDHLGKQFFWFKYKFQILHTESGSEAKRKVMQITVNGITGSAKAETCAGGICPI